MYLASFRIPEAVILQGMVRLPGLPYVAEGVRSQWWRSYFELIQGIPAGEGVGASLRVTLTPGMPLNRTLLICASEARAMELRQFLAPFTRLDALVTGSAILPLTREDYDTVADDVPLMRCQVTTSGFQSGGALLACDFRINPLLDSLFAEAATHGYHLAYHVNIRYVEIDREQNRAARRNALEVRDLAGVPQPLVTMQQRLADQLLHSSAVCEEYIAVDPGPAVQWLCDALRRYFKLQFENLGFGFESWDFVEGGYEGELACAAFTMSSEMSVDELCSTAVQHSQVVEILGWCTSEDFANCFVDDLQSNTMETEGNRSLPAGMPTAYEGKEPFIFVSYKRSDLDRVIPVTRWLQGVGCRIWYDQGIRGGDDWTAVLEERLVSCSTLLLFLSQQAIDSKYVRREVLFADSLEKRIVSVRVSAAQLKYGMGLLLPRYQIIEYGANDFFIQLTRALKLDLPRDFR